MFWSTVNNGIMNRILYTFYVCDERCQCWREWHNDTPLRKTQMGERDWKKAMWDANVCVSALAMCRRNDTSQAITETVGFGWGRKTSDKLDEIQASTADCIDEMPTTTTTTTKPKETIYEWLQGIARKVSARLRDSRRSSCINNTTNNNWNGSSTHRHKTLVRVCCRWSRLRRAPYLMLYHVWKFFQMDKVNYQMNSIFSFFLSFFPSFIYYLSHSFTYTLLFSLSLSLSGPEFVDDFVHRWPQCSNWWEWHSPNEQWRESRIQIGTTDKHKKFGLDRLPVPMLPTSMLGVVSMFCVHVYLLLLLLLLLVEPTLFEPMSGKRNDERRPMLKRHTIRAASPLVKEAKIRGALDSVYRECRARSWLRHHYNWCE